jgi:hypothetical protein
LEPDAEVVTAQGIPAGPDFASPSLPIRIVPIIGLAGVAAGIAALAMGHTRAGWGIALAVFWANTLVSTPSPAPEPETLADLSHIDWAAPSLADNPGLAVWVVLILMVLGLAWYLDVEGDTLDLIAAGLWIIAATIQSVKLIYSVWLAPQTAP